MNKALFLLLAFCLLVRAFGGEVRHLELNGAHLIDTNQNNYALASPNLLQNQWKTVSVNGNNVNIYSPTCQMISKTVQSLTPAEKNLIDNAKNQLLQVENNNSNNNNLIQTTGNGMSLKYGSSRYSLDAGSNKMQVTRGMNVNFSSYNNNGMSISKSDENNFSASKQGMPNNLARIFVNGDIVTYVYLNGEVQMKPKACLTPAETQLNEQIRLEAQQAEQQFKQNMQQFQQNMQQSMQNMQNNLQNMFGNGFPFNNNNMMMNGNAMMGTNGMMNNNNMMANGFMGGYPNNQFQQQSFNSNGMQNGFGGNFGSAMNQLGGGAMQSMSTGNFPNFGNNFPFGPNNSPFTQGFPFNG